MQERLENISDITELQKSAGRVMLVIIDVVACRMEGWKFMILDGVARCWVGLVDFDSNGIGKLSSCVVLLTEFVQTWNYKISCEKLCPGSPPLVLIYPRSAP